MEFSLALPNVSPGPVMIDEERERVGSQFIQEIFPLTSLL